MKNSRALLVISFLALVTVACKTTQNQEASTSSVTKVELTEPIKIDIAALRFDTTGGKVLRADIVRDSLVINLTKTPCYGTCPVFTADIYEKGHVIFNGKRNTRRDGLHTATMSADDLRSIRKMAVSIKYFDFRDEYDSPVTDLPSTYTTVNVNGQKKTIKNRVGGPEDLRAFENHIQKILDSLTWTKAESDSGN